MGKHNQIFIIGHSGAGKGVLAQAIAKQLGWKFIDADFSLSPSLGLSLSEILGTDGEQNFHKKLSQTLDYQLTQSNIVVTTDDALVCTASNREKLKSTFTVNLQVGIDVQLERIGHNRPLIPNDNFKEFLNQLRAERDAWYDEVASYAISSDDGEIDAHVTSVINTMNSK